jgi:hypothetical protein
MIAVSVCQDYVLDWAARGGRKQLFVLLGVRCNRGIDDHVTFRGFYQERVAESLNQTDCFIHVYYFVAYPGQISGILSHSLLGAYRSSRRTDHGHKKAQAAKQGFHTDSKSLDAEFRNEVTLYPTEGVMSMMEMPIEQMQSPSGSTTKIGLKSSPGVELDV